MFQNCLVWLKWIRKCRGGTKGVFVEEVNTVEKRDELEKGKENGMKEEELSFLLKEEEEGEETL